MKAAVWNEKGSLDVVERQAPDPKPGWVRLRIAAVGICGTDLHFHRGGFPSPAGLQRVTRSAVSSTSLDRESR